MKRRRMGSVGLTSLAPAGLALACTVLAGDPLRADLASLWRMNETTGTTAPNSVVGGADGALFGGASWVADAERGWVLAFDGSTGCATAGTLPALALGDDYSWSFWSASSQGANSNVILGNRYDGPDSTWLKFTTAKLEYASGGVQMGIDYADIGAGSGWMFHAVVKSGSLLTYYRNGAAAGVSTVTAGLTALPLRFGGDPTTERWGGKMDNAALFSHALTVGEVSYAMLGMYGRFAGLTATNFTDTFDGAALDAAKWDVATKGLESNYGSGYNDPAVSGGQITLGGATLYNYWRGCSLATRPTFAVPAGGELRFSVDRISLTGSGTGSRSSLWMYADYGNFVHFSQNTEGNGGFSYNANNQNPTGTGVNLTRADYLDTNLGNHRMTMAHDGAFVKLYVDGRYLASQATTFTNKIALLLTGQARAASDTVSAVFDNAAAATRTYRPMYDNFNGGALDPAKWSVIYKGLESQGTSGTLTASVPNGELVLQGSAGAQYWHGATLQSVRKFAPRNKAVFNVDRDAIEKGAGSAVRSSVWLWADDNHFLLFSQNLGENGWQYNYADGTRVAESTGPGVNIPAFDALDGDTAAHEMKLTFARTHGGAVAIEMYLDGQLGATRQFNNWGDLEYKLMLSGMPRASGDSVYVAFDNMQVEVIPAPGTVFMVQ